MGTTDLGPWVHSGRVFSAEEIAAIRATVAWLPGLARKELAATLCEHLGWHTVSGTAKVHACGELLARLEAAGLLAAAGGASRGAPAPGARSPRRWRRRPRRRCAPRWRRWARCTWRWCARPRRWCSGSTAVARWHPLGFNAGAFGYRLRYFIRAGDQRLGCVLLAGAARALAVRDRWIGWDAQARREQRVRVLNNSRFLIFPARPGAAPGQPCAGTTGAARACGLATALGLRAAVAGDLRRSAPLCRHLLSRRRVGAARADQRARPGPTGSVLSQHPRQVWVKPLSADWRARLCAAPRSARP